MRLLFLGDIVGRAGRDALVAALPDLRARLALDVVIVNGENAAHGFGITEAICAELYAAGVDCITGGNHSWDKREALTFIDRDTRLLRPLNYPEGTPGRGAMLVDTPAGRLLVINVLGRLFMDPLDDPFACIEAELAKVRLGATVDAIVIDAHGEATSEKTAIGVMVDGRVSAVVGSHTHVPTADWRILPGGTAYHTDTGMCGDYESIIGMEKTEPLNRFRKKISQGRLQPAQGPATLCGTYVETDDKTGLAVYIAPLRLGGVLHPAWPLPSNEPA